MSRFALVVVSVVMLSACSGDRQVVDDRPPPFADREVTTQWPGVGDGPDQAWIDEQISDFGLPILLVPSPSSVEGSTGVMEIRNEDWSVFVGTALVHGDQPIVRVDTSNTFADPGCRTGESVAVRGTTGCHFVDGVHHLLRWEEEWVHEARWTVETRTDDPIGWTIAWLNTWIAHW